jgi:tRNA-intron endonuclease
MVTQRKTDKQRKPQCLFIRDIIYAKEYQQTEPLYDRSCFGTRKNKTHFFTLEEAMYLYEKDKIEIIDRTGKPFVKTVLLERMSRTNAHFLIRYAVYSDLRKKGYIPKTALKFGSAFRVYDKGVRPGEDHARWIVLPVKETDRLKWYDFCAQARVAHSTRKRLLIAVVDAENDVSYYETQWIKV